MALCPYGQVGDVLWVRETWAETRNVNSIDNFLSWRPHKVIEQINENIYSAYMWRADGEADWVDDDGFSTDRSHWKPSIFMPREASRIKLRITDIRVERLQDISKADAIAEGVLSRPHSEDPQLTLWYDYSTQNRYAHGKGWGPVESYQSLWQSINGKPRVYDSDHGTIKAPATSWESNPFVWVIQFERITDLAL